MTALCANLQAQESGLARIHRIAQELNREVMLEDSTLGGKCGTHLVASFHERGHQLDKISQASRRQTLGRPVLETSRLSPSGRFRIHYDTTGFYEPAMIQGNSRIPNSYSVYVDSVAAIFDHVWKMQIDVLGYDAPPTDKGKGGGLEYDVYIVSLGGGTFGVTYWEDDDAVSTGSNQRYATYMEIDNDYLFYRTSGLNGLRVTAAHEFHHAIQIGSYGIWPNVSQGDLYFYEMTSTWIEDVVYPQINDYLFDAPRYFRQFVGSASRSIPFLTYDMWLYPGYERAVFLHYLARRHGNEVIREVWKGIAHAPFKISVDQVLKQAGTRFEAEFANFSYWNFYTADRANRDRYYPEGHLYPRMVQNMRVTYDNFSTIISSEAYPVSTQFYEFVTQNDTLIAILVNVDLTGATNNPNTLSSFDLRIMNNPSQGAIQTLSSGAKGALSVTNFERWRVMYLSATTRSDIKTQEVPYPNPVRPDVHPYLRLPVERPSPNPIEVVIYSVSLDRVFSGTYGVTDSFGRPEVILSTNDFAAKVSSGIYFVVVRDDQKEYRWKVAFVR